MIGVDIISIDRISKLKERFRENFLRRFLSEHEISMAKNDASIAGLWAAKEAASKALGVGIGIECSFFDIIITKDKKNAPIIDFSDKVKKSFGIKNSVLSISHDGGFAIAVVVVQTSDKP
ncbi:holo-ACP synthase [Campylobacter pinnipediorum]|uniref:holo-ACP synthase n=1 Tax=Campylobacter pinnipediorum TaxID=1965231 RepID=UPI00084E0627|nr:holo-ACP synthase [Campylobacter pinnipediorum]AQW84053.1 holo-(acyl-carrier-protein) synthase [Campylobacter pinnipediorum subsp. pinnipediorum]